jgi:hypothetical protein
MSSTLQSFSFQLKLTSETVENDFIPQRISLKSILIDHFQRVRVRGEGSRTTQGGQAASNIQVVVQAFLEVHRRSWKYP